jgi:peptide/nickel transport system substrate-binding protein/microcin C transport system substrate-binding protein
MKLFTLITGLIHIWTIICFATENGTPNPEAVVGGNFYFNLRGEPNTLHPITSTDFYARKVYDFTMDSLADYNYETYQMEPHLAERWEISKNNKEFTFFLRKNAKFHDGKSVTAEDVKFSFDAIFEPKYEAAHLRPFYENIEKVEVMDQFTVRFFAKNTYFKNFEQLATLYIIPKHVYQDVEKAKKMTKELVGAGPYKLEKFDRGEKLVLRRFDDWYGFSEKHFKGFFNFEKMTARFIRDETLALEMLKKGELDFTEMRADAYQLKANGAPWGTKIKKIKYENMEPKNWYFYGWNMRSPVFKSRNVRLALTYLMDRESMVKKFLFGFSKPAVSPIWFQNQSSPVGLKAIPYDPGKAQKLLKEDGWSDSDKNGILDKTISGVKTEFKFTLLHPNKDYDKFHTWYKEDLKKAGIEMEIKMLEWSSFEPLVSEGKFDVMAMAWGGGDQDPDPKQIWHSTSSQGGSNYIAYKNPEVDKMIDDGRLEVNSEKRIKLFRKIYEKLAEDAPYTCWFNTISEFYGVSTRVQRPADSLKYKIGIQTWWINPK